jgi:hypothetical protein
LVIASRVLAAPTGATSLLDDVIARVTVRRRRHRAVAALRATSALRCEARIAPRCGAAHAGPRTHRSRRRGTFLAIAGLPTPAARRRVADLVDHSSGDLQRLARGSRRPTNSAYELLRRRPATAGPRSP